MEAIEIYNSLSQPPKTALRKIEEGTLKGKTDINPQWRYKAMTEKFGLVGLGWKYEIRRLWTEKGAGNEVLAFAEVAVFVRDPDTKEWTDAIVGIGGSKLINDFQRGPKSNDEGYKMAVTDAFSTSLKMLGVAADIYAGRWDGSKYIDGTEEPAQNQKPALKGGPDTPEQKAKIKALLDTTDANGKRIFTDEERKQVSEWRKTTTADEVIKSLEQYKKDRLTEIPPEVF